MYYRKGVRRPLTTAKVISPVDDAIKIRAKDASDIRRSCRQSAEHDD
jgi:hypothetical protein